MFVPSGPGSFFKAHQDTPRGPNMFGSLVIVFPTPHEGGALVLRSDNGERQEEVLDFSAWLKETETPSVAYALFFGDITHEVYEVTRGPSSFQFALAILSSQAPSEVTMI